MRFCVFAALFFALITDTSWAQQDGPRGDAAAVAAAERMLEDAGGRDAWRHRRFEVLERGYLRSGETAELRIVRDFERGARLLESRTAQTTSVEWLSPEEGWTETNGRVERLRREDLQLELQGLRQEPYSIYYRLAHRDRGLRFELRENGTVLMVFDQDERPLCYFFRAGDGSVIGWGNYYNGRINQHYYGPVADMGDVRLPRWGAATDGRFRFEYLRATVDDRPLTTP